MKLWPWLLDLTVGSPERERPLHLWLPIIIVWPILLFLLLVMFIVTVLVDFVLVVVGRPYHHYTLLVYRTFALLSDLRGMVVSVKDKDNTVDMTVY